MLGSLLAHVITVPDTGLPARFRIAALRVVVVPDWRVTGVEGVSLTLAGVLSGSPLPPHAARRARRPADRKEGNRIAANVGPGEGDGKSERVERGR
jgi:hypothetical protein